MPFLKCQLFQTQCNGPVTFITVSYAEVRQSLLEERERETFSFLLFFTKKDFFLMKN
jgi:hypothetical protein